MPITKLDPITINQIAAGEVIDRPVSIIKELIDNAIDANAKLIKIHIEEGGKKAIKVTDTGKGISQVDLPLAAWPHSTSKITHFEDIYATESLGFRGEALSSICHVAKLTIFSKPKDQPTAYEITAKNKTISSPIPTAHTNGTTMQVTELFEQIPVRKNFLKSAATEKSHIIDLVIKFALLFPDIDFILTEDDKEIINTCGIKTQKERLILLYGKNTKDHLNDVSFSYGPIIIKGLISDPTCTFANKNKQVLAINNRLVKSNLIQKAIAQTYTDLIPAKRFPLILLNISLPPEDCDINIHPQKQEIKLINPQMIFQAIPRAIHKSLHFHQSDLNQSIQPSPPSIEKQPLNTYKEHRPTPALNYSPLSPNKTIETNTFQNISSKQEKETTSFKNKQNVLIPTNETPFEYLQLFDTYIIIKTPKTLYILDQHAVHERILYEQLKTKQNQTESQALLIAEHITLSPEQYAMFEEKKEFLKSLNLTTETFGNNQIIITEVPLMLTRINLEQWLTDLLSHESTNKTLTNILSQKEQLQMKACKAAIKAGKKLYPEEVKQLIKDFLKAPSNFTCPHGRPLCLKYDKAHLEKLFSRT